MKRLKCVVCNLALKGKQSKFCSAKCKSREYYRNKSENDPEYLPRRREYMRKYMKDYFKRNPEKYELQKARTRNYRRKNL